MGQGREVLGRQGGLATWQRNSNTPPLSQCPKLIFRVEGRFVAEQSMEGSLVFGGEPWVGKTAHTSSTPIECRKKHREGENVSQDCPPPRFVGKTGRPAMSRPASWRLRSISH